MTKKFALVQVDQKFKYGGVWFVKTEMRDWGAFRVNARLDKAGAVSEGDRYYFVWNDEVEI